MASAYVPPTIEGEEPPPPVAADPRILDAAREKEAKRVREILSNLDDLGGLLNTHGQKFTDEQKAQLAVVRYLAVEQKKKPEELAETYTNDLADLGQRLGVANPTSLAVYNALQGRIKVDEAQQAAGSELDDLTLADISELGTGETSVLNPQKFQEFSQKHQDAFSSVPTESLLGAYQQRVRQIQAKYGPYAAKARKASDIVRSVIKAKEDGGSRVASISAESLDALGDLLVDETPEGRAAIREMVAAEARVHGIDPKTFSTMLGEAFTRTFADIGSANHLLGSELTITKRMDVVRSGMGRVLPGEKPSLATLIMPGGMEDGPDFDDQFMRQAKESSQTNFWLKGTPLTESEKAALLAEGQRSMMKIRIIREFRQMAKGMDPIKPTADGWLGTGQNAAYWMAGSAPYLAASVIPYVGLPAVGVTMAVTNAEQIRSEHPDEKPGLALIKGGAISALQMLPMAMSLRMLGRLPLTAAWLRRLEQQPISTFAAAQQKLVRGGLFLGEQALQSEVGAATPLAIKVLAAKLQGDDPSVEWERELSIFNESQPETLGQIVPWFLFAKGVAGIKAIPGALRTIRTERFLADLELPKEKLDAINQAPTDEAAALTLRQALRDFTKEQWQAVARHYDATVNHLRSRLGRPGFPSLRQEVDGQGKTAFTIIDGEGQPVASADSPGMAAHLFEMQDEHEKGARSEVSDQPSSDAQTPIAASGEGEVIAVSSKEADNLTKLPEPDISKLDVGGAEPVRGEEAEQAIARLNGVLVQPHFGYTVRSVDPQGGDLHSSQRTGSAALAREIAKIFGRRVVLFETASGESLPNALVLTGERRYIFLHNRASKPHILLMGHELYHHIEVSAPELAAEVRAALEPLVRNHDALSRSKAPYPENRRFDEVIADLFGDSLSNRNFWDKLHERNPTAFTKIATVVKQWLDKVAAALQAKGFQSYRHFTDIKKAQDVVADALSRFSAKPFRDKTEASSNNSELSGSSDLPQAKIQEVWPSLQGEGNIQWGKWSDYEKVKALNSATKIEETYAKVGERLYSEHAVNRMQPSGQRHSTKILDGSQPKWKSYPQIQQGIDFGRSVPPNIVEYVIKNSEAVVQENSNISHTLGDVQVILSPEGRVVTIVTH